MKKISKLNIIIIFFILSSLFSNHLVSASEQEPTDSLKSQYEFYQQNGFLGPDVSFDTWSNIIIEARLFESHNDFLPSDSHSLSSQMLASTYQMKAGDIFVTNSTSASGIIGHAAIATSGTYILHIPGTNATTELLTLAQWKNKYSKPGTYTWVYRVKNSSVATKAGVWAYLNYWNAAGQAHQTIKPSYSITTNTFSTNPTYCSKIVYQAYWHAAQELGTNIVYNYSGQIVPPYHLRGQAFLQTPDEVAIFVN